MKKEAGPCLLVNAAKAAFPPKQAPGVRPLRERTHKPIERWKENERIRKTKDDAAAHAYDAQEFSKSNREYKAKLGDTRFPLCVLYSLGWNAGSRWSRGNLPDQRGAGEMTERERKKKKKERTLATEIFRILEKSMDAAIKKALDEVFKDWK